MIYYSLYLNKMSKDYSILYELAKEEINEKEVEEKYSEFLDWLKEHIEKNMIIKSKYGFNIPNKFYKLLGTIFVCPIKGYEYFSILKDIEKYLFRRNIILKGEIVHKGELHTNKKWDEERITLFINEKNNFEYFLGIEKQRINLKISSLEQSNQDILKKLEEQIQLNTNLHYKLPKLEEQISELEQTNKEILNKLQEQIKLNEEFSKLNNELCKRIFEMMEEKFKNEKS